MYLADYDGMANSADPDQTDLGLYCLRSSLIRVCTVCSNLSVPIFRIFTLYHTTGKNQTYYMYC